MQSYFNKWFHYSSGWLIWKKSPGGTTKKGNRAGSDTSAGYRKIRLHDTQYMEHRIIWIMHYGDIPEGLVIDHINRIRNDNVIENLRIVTQMVNMNNSVITEESTSRYSCVSFVEKGTSWHACIRRNKITVELGYYEDEKDAARAVNIFCRDNDIEKFNDVPEPFKEPIRKERKYPLIK